MRGVVAGLMGGGHRAMAWRDLREAFVRSGGGAAVWDALTEDLEIQDRLRDGQKAARERAAGRATGARAGAGEAGASAFELLAEGHERGCGAMRKARGIFYTPPGVVERVLGRVLPEGYPGTVRLLDPACGTGNFLVAAAQALGRGRGRHDARGGVPEGGPDASGIAPAAVRRFVESGAFGVDIDPVAVACCRGRLWLSARGDRPDPAALRRRIVHGDFLDPAILNRCPALCGPFDAAAGNPPFLSQLRGRTAASREAAARVATRTGGAVRRYADMAGAFLVVACACVRAGGRVGLVLPQSLLVTADAAGVRSAVEASGEVESIDLLPRQAFGEASVHTCVVTVRVGTNETPGPGRHGAARGRGDGVGGGDAGGKGATWGRLLATQRGVPAVRAHSARTIGDEAAATADFRDQYYGLRGFVSDADALSASERDDSAAYPRLVTSGLIDPGRCRWGERPARLHGRRWAAPVLDRRRFEREAGRDMVRWLETRLVPKVLVATQTRVIEAWADAEGSCVPVVPVITVVPREPERDAAALARRLERLASAIGSPEATAWAMTHYAGAALNPDAVKLSARQVEALPVWDDPNADPVVRDWWRARMRA